MTDGQWMGVATVAPIGDEETGGAVLETGAGGVFEICFSVVEAADQGHPGGRSRADVEWNSGTLELRGFLCERMIRFVPPVEGAKFLFGQAADQFRVLENDVSPEHHS